MVASRCEKDGNLTEKYLIHELATGLYVFVFSYAG